MVSDHISIRPRQRVLDPFQFHDQHDQLDACSRFWGDTEILLAANWKPPKLTPHPQRSELVLPVFRASSTETPRSRPESVTELCFVKKYAFMEADVFRMVQECLTNIHRHSGNGIAKVRVSRSDTDLRVEVEDQGKGDITSENSWKGNRLARRNQKYARKNPSTGRWLGNRSSARRRRNDPRFAFLDVMRWCNSYRGIGLRLFGEAEDYRSGHARTRTRRWVQEMLITNAIHAIPEWLVVLIAGKSGAARSVKGALSCACGNRSAKSI